MGYRFSQQAFLESFLQYFLLFSCHLELPTSIQCDVMVVVSLDDLLLWFQACEQRLDLFQCVMPMAMENLAIAQHPDTLHYVTIHGGGYQPRV
jgi:hypothetical protein